MAVKVLCVAGARPNFMKVAPLIRTLAANTLFQVRLVHTGQHYDDGLSKVFFDDLDIPRPDIELEVGSGSHAGQTAEIMKRFEPVLEQEQPQAVLVVGDVNSTAACTLVAAKFELRADRQFRWRFGNRRRPVTVHVEAGLRSGDDDMPEEINRRVTDALSDLLFVSDPAGLANLRREGAPAERVFFVGNVMIDTLVAAKERALRSPVLEELGLARSQFGVVTLHRPSNVDEPTRFRSLLKVLDELAKPDFPLVFPVHPRTRARLELESLAMRFDPARWKITGPLGYLDFLKLEALARIVITDSGGVQEETTILGVPCVTLRENTERPVTVIEGTNVLAGTDELRVLEAVGKAMDTPRVGRIPRYWDGQAARRIEGVLTEVFAAS